MTERVDKKTGLPWAVPALALALVAALQLPLVVADPLLNRDDRALIEPLRSLASLGEYRAALTSRRILDVQPVRDASFALNLYLERATGHGLFHATNLLLWGLITALLCRLLLSLRPSARWTAAMTAALFAVHPALLMSVSWVAARKHLLSCLFILVATLLWRRASTKGVTWPLAVGAALAYGLSVFSQPITVLWPLWVVAVVLLEGRGRRAELFRVPLVCAPVLVLGLWANLAYYTGRYVQQIQSTKFVEGFNPGISVLALGRAFFNLICPGWIATSYEPGRSFNLVGVVLLVLFGFWVKKRLSTADAVGWGLFALLPLAVVFGKMTHIFMSDPYLLTPAVGLACLALLLAEPLEGALPATGTASLEREVQYAHPEREGPLAPSETERSRGATRIPFNARKVAGAVAVLALPVLATLSIPVVHSWSTDAAVWAHAYEVEPTPNALAKHSFFLANEGRTREALEVALRLKAWAPAHPELPLVLGRAIFLDGDLTPEQKDALLTEQDAPHPWYRYFQAVVRAQLGRFQDASALMRKALRYPDAFRGELPGKVAEATVFCVRAHQSDCAAWVEPFRRHPGWVEAPYAARLSQEGLTFSR